MSETVEAKMDQDPSAKTDSEESVEVDREVVEETIETLGSVSLTLRGATAYSKAETVERQQKELKEEIE